LVELKAPTSARMAVARRIKEAFDALEFVDSGWWHVDVNHPAFGRDGGGATLAERIPGDVIPSTAEPPAGAEAVIVAVGFEDPSTGEVHTGNLLTSAAAPESQRNPRDEDSSVDSPDERLPALALFVQDGKLMALIGTIHNAEEARFELSGTW